MFEAKSNEVEVADEFAAKVAAVVGRHPGLCYSKEVEDGHFLLRNVPFDAVHDEYLATWKMYNSAMADAIVRMVRYERSLKAWAELLRGVEDADVARTVLADYVDPVFHYACDAPLMFKDEVAHGGVGLTWLATGRESTWHEKKEMQGGWFKEFDKVVMGSREADELRCARIRDLHESSDIKHVRAIHGEALHDASSTLLYGLPRVVISPNGVGCVCDGKPVNLADELGCLARVRIACQGIYSLFYDYALMLYERL